MYHLGVRDALFKYPQIPQKRKSLNRKYWWIGGHEHRNFSDKQTNK